MNRNSNRTGVALGVGVPVRVEVVSRAWRVRTGTDDPVAER